MVNKNLIKNLIIPFKCLLTVKIGSTTFPSASSIATCRCHTSPSIQWNDDASICIISPAYFDLGRLGCASCSSSILIDSFISFLTFSEAVSFILSLSFFFNAFFVFLLAFGESTSSALIQLLSVVSLIFIPKSLSTISQK